MSMSQPRDAIPLLTLCRRFSGTPGIEYFLQHVFFDAVQEISRYLATVASRGVPNVFEIILCVKILVTILTEIVDSYIMLS